MANSILDVVSKYSNANGIVGSMIRMFVARVVRLATRKELVTKYETFNQFGAGTSAGVDTAYHSILTPDIQIHVATTLTKLRWVNTLFIALSRSSLTSETPNKNLAKSIKSFS